MTQENKDLLFNDISSRLSYRVKFSIYWWNEETQTDEEIVATLYSINTDGYCEIFDHDGTVYIDNIKPYLRPMSSMTDEEREELKALCNKDLSEFAGHIMKGHGLSHDGLYMFDKLRQLDWLNKHHFDYRGLIEMGLALEAPEDIYN